MACIKHELNLESDVLQNSRKTVLTTSIVIKTSACALRCHAAVCAVSWVELSSGQSRRKSQFLIGTIRVVLSYCRCYCKASLVS